MSLSPPLYYWPLFKAPGLLLVQNQKLASMARLWDLSARQLSAFLSIASTRAISPLMALLRLPMAHLCGPVILSTTLLHGGRSGLQMPRIFRMCNVRHWSAIGGAVGARLSQVRFAELISLVTRCNSQYNHDLNLIFSGCLIDGTAHGP